MAQKSKDLIVFQWPTNFTDGGLSTKWLVYVHLSASTTLAFGIAHTY